MCASLADHQWLGMQVTKPPRADEAAHLLSRLSISGRLSGS